MSDIDDDEPPTATSASQAISHHDIEDEVQDWKLLGKRASQPITSSSAIPKRGEKEFEPDGTTVQNKSLQESQQAMFDALSNIRGHHIKHKLIGVWVPKLNQCVILQIRGNFFRDMGIAHGPVMYLNQYETVYLVERGSLIAYLSNEEFETRLDEGKSDFDIESKLWALDLEYLYCLTKLDISQYQVYAYLKRLGYILQTPSVKPSIIERGKVNLPTLDVSFWLLPRKWGILAYPALHTCHFKTKSYFNFTNIYKAITIDNAPIITTSSNEKLQITYNVWRPTPSFAKKSPPYPDFQLVVVDSSKSTYYLSLSELHNLQSQLQVKQVEPFAKKPPKKQPRVESKRQIRAKQQAVRQSKLDKSIQLRNEYWKRRDSGFKQGSSPVIVAVVNQGVINFINLSTGNFNCKFNKDDLDEIYPGKPHSIIHHE